MSRALVLAFALAAALPAAAAAPRGADPEAAPAPGGPLHVTRAFYRALHAGDAARAATLAAGDARASLRAYVRLARAHRELEAAVARRYGRESAGFVGYGNKVQAEVKALLGASEEIEDGAARVVSLDGRVIATLRRVGKAWKVELDDALGTPGGAARLEKSAAVSEVEGRRVTAGIRAGRYPDAEAAVRDFQLRVAKATGEQEPEPEAGQEGVAL